MPDIKRVVFFGSLAFGLKCFKYLLSRQDLRVVALLTHSPESKNQAGMWHKEFTVLAHQYAVRLIADEKELGGLNIDIGFSVHYLDILKKSTIDLFPLGIVNLHPGPLPEYRGSLPFIHAICDGRTRYGSTIHFINEWVDAGPILHSTECTINPDMTSWQLLERVRAMLYNDFAMILPEILSGKIHAIEQEEIIKNTGVVSRTYTRAMLEEKRKIDFSWPSEKIYNHLRAFQFPGIKPAYTVLGEKTIYFKAEE